MPRFSNTASTPALCSSRMPASTNEPPRSSNSSRPSSSKRMITGARMLAKTTPAWRTEKTPARISAADPTPNSRRSATPFFSAFSNAARSASSSMSTPSACLTPSLRAAIDRMPEPHPMSITSILFKTLRVSRTSSSSSRHNCVEGCAPVPKAIPGSIKIGMRSFRGGSSQAGTIISFFPIGIGR